MLNDSYFVDPYELYETENPALKKVLEAHETFKHLSEKAFYAGLPKVLKIVYKHFNITK